MKLPHRLVASAILLGLTACQQPLPRPDALWQRAASTAAAAHPTALDLDVTLAPATHEIHGRAAVTVAVAIDHPATTPCAIEWVVHPDLTLALANDTAVRLLGPASDGDHHVYLTVHDHPTPSMTIEWLFGGRLMEDLAAGENPSAIHNFSVNAHIGPEGVYLADGAAWYPRIRTDRAAEPHPLAVALTVDPLPGFELVAGCPRVGSDRWSWRSTHGLDGVTVAGGPLARSARRHGRITIETLLHTDNAGFADGLLDAVAHYLDLYEPLLGPYPYDHFTVVENFFSSGFACPTFTLLGSAVIQMGERGLRPGYLDHELVHNWWGNGVFVDPRDGNWCEALTSYCTNYYRHIAEDRAEDARIHRRNILNGLAGLQGERDQPLSAFGREPEVSRSIGYHKGELVFHELSRRIGTTAFFDALTALRTQRVGHFAGWADLQHAFEAASSRDLGPFFAAWVHGSGLPEIALRTAEHDAAAGMLTVEATGDERFGLLQVPLQVRYADGSTTAHTLELPGSGGTARFAVPSRPDEVVLDPDYELPRRLPRDVPMPVLGMVGKGGVTALLPATPHDAYTAVAQRYASDAADVIRSARDPDGDDLTTGSVLVLGDAVSSAAGRAVLADLAMPIDWTAGGFMHDGTRYDQPGDAVLCTVRRPGGSADVVTVYVGNAPEALHNHALLGFYANSLIVFRDGMPVARQDFQGTERCVVTAR